MRLLPQLLTRTGVPNIAAAPARLPPEWWPASGRNGGPLHVGAVAHFNIGMLARFASEYPARFRRNSHLERGRFIWPSAVDGVVAISAAQLGYMLEAIDWRNPQHTSRPQLAG